MLCDTAKKNRTMEPKVGGGAQRTAKRGAKKLSL